MQDDSRSFTSRDDGSRCTYCPSAANVNLLLLVGMSYCATRSDHHDNEHQQAKVRTNWTFGYGTGCSARQIQSP